MKLIDVTVPIDSNLATYSGNTPFSLEGVKRLAMGDRVPAEDLTGYDLREDMRLLLETSKSRLWATRDFHQDFIGLSEGAARFPVDRGVNVLAVEYLSVEPYKTPGAPARVILRRT